MAGARELDPFKRFYRERYKNERIDVSASDDEPTFAARVAAALAVIGTQPSRILDYGCGSGGAVRKFVDAGHLAIGVDISDSGIDLARRKVPEARFELLEAGSKLPFADGSFDVCYSSEVIEHLFDVQEFLLEVHRVLTPDGVVILTAPYHGWIKNIVIATYDFDRHFDPYGPHIRFFSRKSLTKSLADAAYEVTGFRGIGRRWPVWKSMFVTARKLPRAGRT